MIDQMFYADLEDRMKKTVEALRREFTTVRTGRASPALLDRVTVEAYEEQMPLKQVANISIPEARLIVIQPWDASLLGAIEKAIQKADIGINPNNDGKIIRLAVPALTEERRRDLVKVIKKKAEESKVAVRNIRRDAMEELKAFEKNGSASKDDVHRAQKEVDKVTDKYVKELDTATAGKETEIMEL